MHRLARSDLSAAAMLAAICPRPTTTVIVTVAIPGALSAMHRHCAPPTAAIPAVVAAVDLRRPPCNIPAVRRAIPATATATLACPPSASRHLPRMITRTPWARAVDLDRRRQRVGIIRLRKPPGGSKSTIYGIILVDPINSLSCLLLLLLLLSSFFYNLFIFGFMGILIYVLNIFVSFVFVFVFVFLVVFGFSEKKIFFSKSLASS
jgi:hypothetical protein